MPDRHPDSPVDPRQSAQAIPFHCGNNCPAGDDPGDPDTDLYPCGYRHWCPWCGDCEYCYGTGPHEWD